MENEITIKPIDAIWTLIQSQSITVRRKIKERLDAELSSYQNNIPKEFYQDPHIVSPSGDKYWSDKRNLDDLKNIQKMSANQDPAFTANSPEDINKLLGL